MARRKKEIFFRHRLSSRTNKDQFPEVSGYRLSEHFFVTTRDDFIDFYQGWSSSYTLFHMPSGWRIFGLTKYNAKHIRSGLKPLKFMEEVAQELERLEHPEFSWSERSCVKNGSMNREITRKVGETCFGPMLIEGASPYFSTTHYRIYSGTRGIRIVSSVRKYLAEAAFYRVVEDDLLYGLLEKLDPILKDYAQATKLHLNDKSSGFSTFGISLGRDGRPINPLQYESLAYLRGCITEAMRDEQKKRGLL